LLKEIQALSVTKAVIYRNVDRKAWEQIADEHQGATVVVVVPQKTGASVTSCLSTLS
jgi:hypothetical protein